MLPDWDAAPKLVSMAGGAFDGDFVVLPVSRCPVAAAFFVSSTGVGATSASLVKVVLMGCVSSSSVSGAADGKYCSIDS
jgi:hypothetical protein